MLNRLRPIKPTRRLPWATPRAAKVLSGSLAARLRASAVLVWALANLSLVAATSVTQFGITWTFSTDRTVGQYANGDFYVVGPVTITAISPASVLLPTRTDYNGATLTNSAINGSMVNPTAGPFAQNGFDATNHGGYNPTLNVARPGNNELTPGNPLVLPAGSSLVSTISVTKGNQNPQLTDAAVLTVVAAPPPPGSFRPPYCGTDKTHYWNKSDLDYSILKNLAPVAGAAAPNARAAGFARPWLEVDTQYSGRETHPLNNQPTYGRDLAGALGDGLLTLHLNYSNAEKELLYVRLVQIGIDFYGAAKSGASWDSNGGHNLGRKGPVLLAALGLHDPNIQAYANHAVHPIFQEDQGTFTVPQSWVGQPVNDQYLTQGRPRYRYTQAMVGLPEWGIDGFSVWNAASNWGAIYRVVNFPTFFQTALFAHLLTGGKAAWNHDVFFDYADRAKLIGPEGAYSAFAENMWQSYRSLGASAWVPPAPVQAAAWVPVTGNTITLEASAKVSAGAAGEGDWTLTASGGPISVTGNGTGNGTTQHTRTLSRVLGVGETVTLAISNPGNGLEASQGGADLPSFTGLVVVNYSTATAVPVITTQPLSRTVVDGTSVTFSVVASSAVPQTYQWFKDSVALGGATGSRYVIANAHGGDAGSYAVLVTNSGGSVTSNAAVLTLGAVPAGFDVDAYLARYPLVAVVHAADPYGAWLYYRDHGIYDGEVFDDLFRVEEYLSLYPELFAVFGGDLGGALLHWLTQGRIEGRLGRMPPEFNAAGYFVRNPDVAAAVNGDAVLAWGHYWAYGIYEGRAFDEELRVFEYLAINADLTAAFVNDWRAATLHWMRYGRTEGRLGRLPLIFDVTEYLTRNPDVAATWGSNPTTVFLHYWAYGVDEARTFDDDFRPDDYLALNADVAAVLGTDRRGAFKHWVRYGRDEGRLGRNP